jgi:spectinomycin phosphotransferase/16S rRNA (guanine(1405)-N(7))-methyltransferase
MLVDWESALIAPPERDLWGLDAGDGSILRRYRAAAGSELSSLALSFYRLYYDLFEIGGYVGLFRRPHADDEDSRESWKNLTYFLRPAQRWPHLVG